jgi:hypothetical protein
MKTCVKKQEKGQITKTLTLKQKMKHPSQNKMIAFQKVANKKTPLHFYFL